MLAVAALLDRRSAVRAIRRAFPRADWHLFVARSTSHLLALLYRHALDAVVLGGDAARGPALVLWREHFPAIPLLVYLPLRADDAEFLAALERDHVAGIAVEGLDEPALARIVSRQGVTARRVTELAPLARRLDLTEPLQRRAWQQISADAPRRPDTASLAHRLGVRRETLSRSFAAGRAPTLKRAIDGVRLVAAARLLANPGYSVADAARLLRFSSVSSLQATSRRTFGVPARSLARLDAGEIVAGLAADGAGIWS